MKQIYFLLLVLLIAASCSEEQPLTYKGKDAIYIKSATRDRMIEQTFYILPSTQNYDTVWIDVQTMGHASSKDRSFIIKQMNVGADSAAISGTHFVPLDDNSLKEYMIIKADTVAAKVPIVLIKTPDMDLEKFKLVLEMEENEHFSTIDLPVYADLTIFSTNTAVKPANWDTFWIHYFGEWGSRKIRLLIDSTGYVDWHIRVNDNPFVMYMKRLAEEALYKYNQSHDEPMMEADGTLVTFPEK